MTDKIKKAREWVETSADFLPSHMTHHYETILEALSAYERLQGVDLDGMKEKFITVNNITPYTRGYKIGYNQAIDDVKARLVADIGGK